ncbi:hypothetical protein HNR46_002946 [Haloferula luteola]|uniref:Cache domain-containing protein n=1 Tax=Haloferula luteola TaxID=595692 RepID=A0A840VDI9_9BACT|nr:hypothetical protein [Haloferula luteola]MBB5352698.1 hypothetical protein [Haloferula luteola]
MKDPLVRRFASKPDGSPGKLSRRVWIIGLGGCMIPIWVGCRRKVAMAARPPLLDELAARLEASVMETEAQCLELVAKVADAYGRLQELSEGRDLSEYAVSAEGVVYRPDAIASGEPAVFVSGAVPMSPEIEAVVLATEAVDPGLKSVVEEHLPVVQAYYNDRHSFNRIYPPFDVLIQYPAGMIIPDYNFYYLADARHNPDRTAVWVNEPYVDPAGRGWMVSCVAPVYVGDQLEGVCGLDITIEALVRELDLEKENRFFLLLAEDGTVVATGEAMIQVLRLPPLKNHRYVDTVRSDIFRSGHYNLLKNSSAEIRSMGREVLAPGCSQAELNLDDRRWAVHVRDIRHLRWKMLAFSVME